MERRAGIRIEGDASGYLAAANQAEAASRRLNEQNQVQAAGMRQAAQGATAMQQALSAGVQQVSTMASTMAAGNPVLAAGAQQMGAVATAIGGMSASATVAVGTLGALAATVLVGGIAYNRGRAEIEAYHRAIIMTGNAAGVTAGQLDQMARRVAGGGTYTQGAAAGVLSQLVGTGDVRSSQLAGATEAALALQRSLGVEVEKTVRAFSMMGDKPLQGALKINEQYHFLTLEVYEQIKALEKRGDVDGAAARAQSEFARVAKQRAAEMEGQLGSLEKAWRGVREMAAKAWDAMLGVGRQQTIEQQLAELDRQLEAPMQRGRNPLQAEARRDAMLERREALQESLRMASRAASLQRERDRQVRDQARADSAGPGRTPRVHLGDSAPMPFLEWERLQKEAEKARERALQDDIEIQRREFDQRAAAGASADAAARDGSRQAWMALGGDISGMQLSTISDPRARGMAQLAAEEAAMRERLRIRTMGAQEQKAVEEDLAKWRVLREHQLTEELKPEWQRMLEAWQDNARQMKDTFDSTMTAAIQAGEQAWVQWATTGKLSVKSLGDAISAEVARGAFRQFVGMLSRYFVGGGGGSDGVYNEGGVPVDTNVYATPSGAGGTMGRLSAAGGGVAAASAGPRITIINQSGTALEGTSRVQGDGSVEILLRAFKSSVAGDIAGGEGEVTAAIRNRFGLRDSFGSA